jgi:hypothetical protein
MLENTELNALEDGTVPATFSVIFVVCTCLTRLCKAYFDDTTDRMEAVAESAETVAPGKRTNESEGCIIVGAYTMICLYAV